MPRKICLVPYDSNWRVLFEEESDKIKQALGSNCLRIHHIGSTAIPGIWAKPIIDMVPVVKEITHVQDAISEMELLNYTFKGEYGIPFRRFFQKFSNNPTHNAHIFQEGHPEIDRHLRFVNYLQRHVDDREAYTQLKQMLAQQFPHDVNAYCEGKTDFVRGIDQKALGTSGGT